MGIRTIVKKVPKQRNKRVDNGDLKKGTIPLEFGKNKNKLSQKDCLTHDG